MEKVIESLQRERTLTYIIQHKKKYFRIYNKVNLRASYLRESYNYVQPGKD